jgi:pyruvate formate lyase activating enzyme
MDVKGFIPNSLLEWEGCISCVLFLPFCNLRCRYCHAGHLLDPAGLPTVDRQEVLSYMRRNRGWLDGAVITGGEPTLHGHELLGLIGDIRATGLKVMVETNGTCPDQVGRLLSDARVDAVSMDVKAPLDRESYQQVTGRDVDVGTVRASIRSIVASGIPHEFRITVVPGLVGQAEVERIAPELSGAQAVAIQNFQPDHCLDAGLREVLPFMPDEMDAMGQVLAGAVQRVVIRGRERGLATRGQRPAPA